MIIKYVKLEIVANTCKFVFLYQTLKRRKEREKRKKQKYYRPHVLEIIVDNIYLIIFYVL